MTARVTDGLSFCSFDNPQDLPAVMLPGGEPEPALAAVTLGCQMVWVPASHL